MAASSDSRLRGLEAAIVYLVALVAYLGAIHWLDNVHILTANGMYKAIQAEPWIADPANARLDPSNYLYFPLYGFLCRVLDWFDVWRGVPWKQLAVLNAGFAAAAVACIYVLVRELTGDGRPALLAALFHLGCGFVVLLAVINEDIMPGYTLVLIAMSLAALWFDQPTVRRVAIVGAVFTLGWLMEWRLLFPTLPALVLALAIAREPLRQRATLIATLGASILVVAGLVVLFWEGHNGAVGLHDVLWTGKGVDSGWAGFTRDKFWLMLAGVGNYLLVMVSEPDVGAAKAGQAKLWASVAVQAFILGVAAFLIWDARHTSRVRAVVAVFLGTFAAGEVFNLYSQPQDPQMQLNVMPWLTVAWGLAVAALLTIGARPSMMVMFACAPLAWNLIAFKAWKGADTSWTESVASIEAKAPPQSTVFLYWGFEPITMWQYALWSRTWDWDGKPNEAKFKWIGVAAGAIRHPRWTADEHAAVLKRDIDTAFNRGHRVVVSKLWDWSVPELAGHLGGLSAAGRAEAIHSMLHRNYDAQPAFSDPQAGPYYELKRR